MVKKIFIAALFVIVLAETAVLIKDKLPRLTASLFQSRQVSFEEYADRVVEKCKDAGYRPSCYDKEIPELMDAISMEDAFEVTRIVQDQDRSYYYCHVLGHELSAREVRKDPSSWKDVVTQCPSGMCSNGCLHGGFQERFREGAFTETEVREITKELTNLCEEKPAWRPTGLEQASCYHALGHLTMYITSAELNKSSEICEEIAVKPDGRNYSQLCFDGVFMQIFQPLEPEDFALVEGKQPTKEEVPLFCGNFTGKKRASCLSESWPLFFKELKNPENLVRFCSMTEESERTRCYNVIFYVMTAQLGFNVETLQNYCAGLPKERQGLCFANAASRMIETDYRNIDKSVRLCTTAEDYDADEECFAELLQYSTYNFHAGSEAFFRLCNSLPEPWSEKCLSKNTAS
ncbi:MAG: hypothetical protein KJI72_01490 [Patescibacteria group bacterium]|nr:hypothetical protein [Patescibacteria group bacterium]